MTRVCVYCASSAKIDSKYFEAAKELAQTLVRENIQVVYGGGATGLMGQLADTVLAEGGAIQGIMPKFMDAVEWGHQRVTDFIFTDTMAERKARLMDGVDALITLPGGSGTLEELLEAITLKRLGKFTQPIVILNLEGYYDPLQTMLERCVEESFMHQRHLEMWEFVTTVADILPAIRRQASWDEDAIHFAGNHQ